jgi:glutathione S-transferase
MNPILYYHPLSSYSWKVLIALYEKDVAFDGRIIDEQHPENCGEWAALWPLLRFPLLRDDERDVTVPETSTIIEYLDLHHPGEWQAIPTEPGVAIEARVMDRLFDNYVMTPMGTVVFNKIRPEGQHDDYGVDQAKAALSLSYDLLETRLADRQWAAGAAFTLADCAAVPSLFYADRIVPFRRSHPVLGAYLARLEARPSFARVLQEKEPYWQMFPFAK